MIGMMKVRKIIMMNNIDILGLVKMFLLVCGGSYCIVHLRNDKGSFGRFLFWMCIIVVILTFIVTGLYLQENGGF